MDYIECITNNRKEEKQKAIKLAEDKHKALEDRLQYDSMLLRNIPIWCYPTLPSTFKPTPFYFNYIDYNNDDTLFGSYELSKVSFKIFRFNITLTGESKFKGNRIISIGVLTEKNALNNTNHISFVHNIVAPKDVLNLKLDVKILNNKKDSDKLDKYKLDIPCEMYSYGAIKAFAFNYCRFTFQTWCDIRDIKDKFSIETYTD